MKNLIVILGPTGVGKTKLSIELAKFYNGEIIALDKPETLIKNANAKDMNEAFIKLIKEKREKKEI